MKMCPGPWRTVYHLLVNICIKDQKFLVGIQICPFWLAQALPTAYGVGWGKRRSNPRMKLWIATLLVVSSFLLSYGGFFSTDKLHKMVEHLSRLLNQLLIQSYWSDTSPLGDNLWLFSPHLWFFSPSSALFKMTFRSEPIMMFSWKNRCSLSKQQNF